MGTWTGSMNDEVQGEAREVWIKPRLEGFREAKLGATPLTVCGQTG
jgi:hypothetical protein